MSRNLLGVVGVSSLLLVAGLGAANAADMSVKAPPPPPTPVATWNGCYIGFNAGSDWSTANFNNANFNTTGFGTGMGAFNPVGAPTNAALMTNDINAGGFTGGGQIGCNWQWQSNIVVGVESDLQYTGSNGSVVVYGTTPVPSSVTVSESFSSYWLNTDRIRLGFTNGPWLFYATGGVAIASVQYNDAFTFTANGGSLQGIPVADSITTTRVGWTAGGGTEWMLNRNWSVKVEYLYVDLGNTGTTATTGLAAFPLGFYTINHRLTESLARVGINYHF